MNDRELVDLLIGKNGEEELADALDLVKAICEEGRTDFINGDIVIDSEYDEENFNYAHDKAREIRQKAVELIRHGFTGAEDTYKAALLFDAPFNFDCYLRYMEFNREPRAKFYEPRRKALLPVVKQLQRLEDDELDVLGISLPPGVGKTTLALFFLTWVAGRHPNDGNLIASHSHGILKGAYQEVLRFMVDNEYLWHDVFPATAVCHTNADDLRIDVGRRKRFQTLQFVSMEAKTIAGSYRAQHLLYCDDLVPNSEVAFNEVQLNKVWTKLTTDLRQRKQGNNVKELHIATRWSVHDPIGRLQEYYADDDRAYFINVPALNAQGESNFDYPYGVGFSTEAYNNLKALMDEKDFGALYMGEPMERFGTLFEAEELRYFYKLPESEPDAIVAVCDTNLNGQDYCVMPIAYQYGQDFYIAEIMCDNSKPEMTDKRCAEILARHNVQMAQFEFNQAGGRVATDVQNALKERGSRCRITTKWSQQNKEVRIYVSSSYVKEHFLFLAKEERNREYETAMRFLTNYTTLGKNKHDDVPDAMTMLANYVQSWNMNTIVVKKRPF